MTAMSSIIHALLVAGDKLDAVVDEMPEAVCADQRLLLTGLARACQLTAEHLKDEETALERALEVVRG